MTRSNRVDHIRITSHPAPGAKLNFPIRWGAASARERGPVIGTVLLETTSALLQSWLGSTTGGIQLTVYALILMAIILWRPTGLMGMITEAYRRYVHRQPARA